MLNASNILVKFGDRVLLDSVNLVVKSRDRIGLVGRNGAGKSTLLKIISGEFAPTSGVIDRPATTSLGFLHQEMEMPSGNTVMEEALKAFEEALKIEKRIDKINTELGERTDYESDSYNQILVELAEATEQFQMLGGHSMEGDTQRVLQGLGFKKEDMDRQTTEFSGGWQMRIELAKMLLQKPDFLLLDEPTNHLDIESIIWLEEFLKDYAGAVIVISHDRSFLNNVTNRTVEIELGRLDIYEKGYDGYLVQRKERREILIAAVENQNRLIAEKQKTINRFMAKATKTKMAQSMQKQLDKMERLEVLKEDTAAFKLRFSPAPRSGAVALQTRDLSKSYGDLHVLKGINLRLDRGDRVAFVGQNGQGKTTLAKILVKQLDPTSGT
ncbi:MAG: ABC-F family ATP-binding cassette domain-containing protein, partial [Saprospiraceae bacterium]|nr:ABC-F family ATP-binding cassette domain-containing protein [Saprospiraceae bacterium]